VGVGAYCPELVDLDLTDSEINVLVNPADGRGRTASELGAGAGTRLTTLTSVLDRLQRRDRLPARCPARQAPSGPLLPSGDAGLPQARIGWVEPDLAPFPW
jgi:hypothetical protein